MAQNGGIGFCLLNLRTNSSQHSVDTLEGLCSFVILPQAVFLPHREKDAREIRGSQTVWIGVRGGCRCEFLMHRHGTSMSPLELVCKEDANSKIFSWLHI